MSEILIVEDEPKVRESLELILKLAGYVVTSVDSVTSAIETLKTKKIKLILLDLLLPSQDGYQLLHYIEQNRIETHVLIVSGDATFSQARRVIQFDFVKEFIKKPYKVESLLQSVHSSMEKYKHKEINKKKWVNLAKSEYFNRFFIQSLSDIVYMLNDKGEFVFVNHAVEMNLGFPRHELKGKHFSYLIQHDDHDKAKYVFNERRTGKRAAKSIELKLRCKSDEINQQLKQFSTVGSLLSAKGVYKDNKGGRQFIGTFGVIRDISQPREMNLSLCKLNLAIEHSPNLIFITDPNGVIEYANSKLYEISGYQSEEVIGRELSVFNADENAGQTNQALWETITAGNVWRGVLKNRRKSGETYWAQQSVAPLLDDAGKIINFVYIQEDVTEALRLSEQLSHEATHDPLTDLINRTEFERRLKRVIQTSKTNYSLHALCYLDLDKFKIVNDTCSHAGGDELLRQISHLFSGVIRQRDSLGRIGGDEFAILMEHCSLEQAQRTAEAIIDAVQNFQFHWGDNTFRIGVSIGIVVINADNGGFDDFMRLADLACYKAKDNGRNSIYIHKPTEKVGTESLGAIGWVDKVNEAIEHNLFELFTQKIVSMNGSGKDFQEILLRMKDESGRIINPDAFLPTAERYQLSTKIDQWVIRNLFTWYANNRDRLNDLELCSVNLSLSSVITPDMTKYIMAQFQEFNIPPHKICFEINESITVSNLTQVIKFVEELKKIGCLFSIDDFAGALSSFAYLKTIPFDFLKIDGVVIRNMVNDEINLAMVRSIIEITHVLGRKTIAKSVESDTVLTILQGYNVDYIQGFEVNVPSPLM